MVESARRIAAAAVLLSDGTALSLPPPARHHDVMSIAGEIIFPARQGFVDDAGKFLGRQQAWQVATRAGQIIRKPNVPGTLFSEDVW